MIKPLLLAATAAFALAATPADAQTVYTNMDGLHADKDGKLSRFTGLVVSAEGRIVSRMVEGQSLPRGGYEVVDMAGAHVLPGLIDAHGHVMGLGEATLTLDLTGTSSIADLQQRLAAYAEANPDLPVIIGRGWNQELFDEVRFPTAADLDRVVADRPVILGRVDGHAVVANTAAISRAKISADTQDPEGGAIERLADGRPAGVFVDTAEELLYAGLPRGNAADADRALAAAQKFALSEGLTAVADMGTSIDGWHAMRRAGDAGRLKMRIMSYSAALEPAMTIAGTGPTPWLYEGKLRMGGIKLYSDGALGSRGALLKEPYEDKPDTLGLPVTPMDELGEQAAMGAQAGFQLAIHAIGDAANDGVLDIFEGLAGGAAARHRIEHVQIVDPVDLPRLSELSVIASMQPVHQTSDWAMAEKRLGMDRLDGAYAWKSLLDSGALLAFGSDFPVEHPNPFAGLEVSVTRTDASGQPVGGWRMEEAITLGQALAAFTHGASYAGFAEEQFGALEPGQYADFIIVDRDISEVDPSDISETEVLATYVGGERVFSAGD
ncbi:amidohydrolase family protein [Sphingomicrobium sp. XHP0235]|uniref:amidohydrolase n=1 Tax=Sphingomicrobium aquimarinum TaxID=3133971 RepID=UPI0031FEB32C